MCISNSNVPQPGNTALAEQDPEVAALIHHEDERQVSGLELIASEVRDYIDP